VKKGKSQKFLSNKISNLINLQSTLKDKEYNFDFGFEMRKDFFNGFKKRVLENKRNKGDYNDFYKEV